jgi:TetR/AcrR family transcriptional regulator, regulator of autoinduction and epiphytic fitness
MSDAAVDEVDPRVERSRRVVREAALHELAEAGYGGFTIDAVARRSGVARSTIYRHWPDKVALIADAFESLNVQPRPAAAPDGEEVADARDRVRRLLVHLAEVFRDSIFEACVPALIDGAERDPKLRAFSHEYSGRRRQALTDAIHAGVASGELPAHVDPGLASAALAGAIVYHRLMTADRFDPSRVDALIDSVLGPPC